MTDMPGATAPLRTFMEDVHSTLTGVSSNEHAPVSLRYCADELLARWKAEAPRSEIAPMSLAVEEFIRTIAGPAFSREEIRQEAVAVLAGVPPYAAPQASPSVATADSEFGSAAVPAESASRCVEVPPVVHRPDFHCHTCGFGYFGPHWEQVDGKWKHVGRACKGTPTGYDRSLHPCKAKYVDYFPGERDGK